MQNKPGGSVGQTAILDTVFAVRRRDQKPWSHEDKIILSEAIARILGHFDYRLTELTLVISAESAGPLFNNREMFLKNIERSIAEEMQSSVHYINDIYQIGFGKRRRGHPLILFQVL